LQELEVMVFCQEIKKILILVRHPVPAPGHLLHLARAGQLAQVLLGIGLDCLGLRHADQASLPASFQFPVESVQVIHVRFTFVSNLARKVYKVHFTFSSNLAKAVGRQNCSSPRPRAAAFCVLHAREHWGIWSSRRHVDVWFAATVVAWASTFWVTMPRN
jgi:hypothetical protein